MTRARRSLAALALTAGTALTAAGLVIAAPASAAEITSVALAGSLQSELGCAADWDPACAATELSTTAEPGVWAAEFTVPAGSYEYKVAFDDNWDTPPAVGALGGGDNIPLTIAGPTTLRFTYDENVNRVGVAPVDLTGGYTSADDALVQSAYREPGSDEQFYFVMTDRFANGDTSNDEGGLGADPLVSGFDPTAKGFYNGGDIQGLRDKLDYIEGLGTSAIWLTPSFLNKAVQGPPGQESAGYHGYWITDFTQIDPHLGTNAELSALIDEAHAKGIKVYFDIITNHTADVIDYQGDDTVYIDKTTRPYTDASGTAFDPADYAGGTTFPTLDPATSFPYVPEVPAAEATEKVPAWLNDVTLYHNRGDSTFAGESSTYGDFSGLDDLMTENPVVVDGFADVYKSWVDFGIDGFRIDTVKHVNLEFWQSWSQQVLDYAHAQGKPDFFMFGEVYEGDAANTSPYVRKTEMNAVLDFPFQSKVVGYASGNSAGSLAELFASDDLYTTPTANAAALPTFLGNHDMGRVGYFLRSTSSPLQRDVLAHELLFLTRGQPVVYYGDEQGFAGAGSGNDQSARQSLFASDVDEYTQQNLITGEQLGSVDRYDETPLYQDIAELSALRSANPALGQGAQIERYAADGPGVYAVSRVDETERIEHLVAFNNDTAAQTVTFTTLTPGATYAPLYGASAAVTAGTDGSVTLTVPALSTVVLKADATVASGAGPVALSVPGPGKGLADVAPVQADIDENTWQQTSFAWRTIGGTDWTPLGVAEDGDPRVFHDVSGLPAGSLVEYRAVTTDASGAHAAASTYGSVGLPVDLTDPPSGDTPITAVSIPGTHNSEMGCAADWSPDCAAAQLTQRADGIWSGTFTLPAGDYEYKVAANNAWTLNWGIGGVPNGDNAKYTSVGDPITFYFDPVSKWFGNDAAGPVATLAGSFQSELGCPADWSPACTTTLMTDSNGDGVLEYTAEGLPAGDYEVKVAYGLGWDENYGADGAENGENIAFSAVNGEPVVFAFDPVTHLLSIDTGAGGPTPTATPTATATPSPTATAAPHPTAVATMPAKPGGTGNHDGLAATGVDTTPLLLAGLALLLAGSLSLIRRRATR